MQEIEMAPAREMGWLQQLLPVRAAHHVIGEIAGFATHEGFRALAQEIARGVDEIDFETISRCLHPKQAAKVREWIEYCFESSPAKLIADVRADAEAYSIAVFKENRRKRNANVPDTEALATLRTDLDALEKRLRSMEP